MSELDKQNEVAVNTAEAPVITQQHPDTLRDPRISEAQAQEAGFVPATDISQFATLVVGWNQHIVNQGQHVLALDLDNPDDPMKVGIRVYQPEHPNADTEGFRLLEDNELVPFKHGVRYMLDMISQLPFDYSPTDADGKVLDEFASQETLAQREKEES